MAANPIPNGIPDLLTMAEDCAEGVQAIGATIGVAQNTEAKIVADIADLRAKQLAYRAALDAQDTRYTTQKNADKAGRVFLIAARRRLVNFLGDEYSAAWGVAGFGPNNTSVPGSIAERQQLLEALSIYFPNHKVQQDMALNITGLKAGILYNTLKDARAAVNSGETAVDDAKKARDAAQKALEKRIRGLIGELEQLLAPDADEWATFDLSAPADPDSPEASEAPAVFARGDGQIEVRIVLSRRADYAHVFVQQIGVDTEARRIDDQFFPPNALIGGLAPGNYNVLVCGVNEGGSGPLSPPSAVAVV